LSQSKDIWRELIRDTSAYLQILRDGGFCFVDGRFEPTIRRAAKAPRPPKPGAPNDPRRTSPLAAEQREMLKAALNDPYAHLVADAGGRPGGRRAAPPPRAAAKSPGGTPTAKGKAKLILRDPGQRAKLVAAAKSLDELGELIAGCHLCGLAASRTHTVPGEGNPNADLVFIGEAPGYHEDMQGRPFVGRAGQLLTDMIRAMDLEREDVFIGNIVKCRPPNNREPRPEEMKACEPYLLRQLELLQPKVICALGRIAIQGLLRETTPIGKLRGQWRIFHTIPLMPTFHPAYLLRNNSQKRFAWEDLQAVMAKLAELSTSA
jgi:DNA polymerase